VRLPGQAKKTTLIVHGVVAEIVFSVLLGALCVAICALVFKFGPTA